MEDLDRLDSIIQEYNLPDDFNINSFENWLPSHNHCNQSNGGTTFAFVPGNKVILDRLIRDAPKVEQTLYSIKKDVTKDKLLAKIFVALEEKAISLDEIKTLVADLSAEAPDVFDVAPGSAKMIRLDNEYWLHRDDVEFEGLCTCDRQNCVESSSRVYCYWSNSLSNWVIRKCLYWKCYDEVIFCPRCKNDHKRGHVGKEGICGRPYKVQFAQTD